MALEDTCRAPEMVCKEYNRHTLRPNGLLEVEDTSVLELEVPPLNIIEQQQTQNCETQLLAKHARSPWGLIQ